MSAEQNLKVVQDFLEILDRDDAETAVAYCTRDFELVVPGPEVVPYAGTWDREHFPEFYRRVMAAIEPGKFNVHHFVAQGDLVVALGDQSFRAASTGRSYAAHWCVVFTLRDGRIREMREFHDTAELGRVFAPI